MIPTIQTQIAAARKALADLPAQIQAAARADKLDVLDALLVDQRRAEVRLPVLLAQAADERRTAVREQAIADRANRVASHDAEAMEAAGRVSGTKAAEKAAKAAAALLRDEKITNVSEEYVIQEYARRLKADTARANASGEVIEADAESAAWSDAKQFVAWAQGNDAPFEPRLAAQMKRLAINANDDDLAIIERLPMDRLAKDRVIYLITVEGLSLIERDQAEAA